MRSMGDIGATSKSSGVVAGDGPAIDPVGGPYAWRASSLEPSWRYRLSDREREEIQLAVHRLEAAGIDPTGMNREAFALPELGERLRAIATEVRHGGRGFAVLEGIPVDVETDRELEIMALGLGLWLGRRLLAQSPGANPFVQHIRDTGAVGNQGRSAIGPHADVTDWLALLCRTAPLAGGETGLSSAATVHDVMLERDPGAVRRMYAPFDHGRCYVCGRQFNLTAFSRRDGEFHGRGPAGGRGGKPSLEQQHAADLFEAIASEPDVQLRFRLRPGELVLVDNTRVLHARAAFIDGEPPRRRHLIRVLPEPEEPIALAADFDWRCHGEAHDWDIPRPGETVGPRRFMPR